MYLALQQWIPYWIALNAVVLFPAAHVISIWEPTLPDLSMHTRSLIFNCISTLSTLLNVALLDRGGYLRSFWWSVVLRIIVFAAAYTWAYHRRPTLSVNLDSVSGRRGSLGCAVVGGAAAVAVAAACCGR